MYHRIFALLCVTFVAVCKGASVAKPTCGGTSSSRNIQLLTPANPPRECIYHIKAYSSYVCQLRIEFAMTLAQPEMPASDNNLAYAECVHDYLQIGHLRLCGVETKQHVYMPFNRTAGVTSVDLSIVLAHRLDSSDLPKPNWDIKVRQLQCPSGASVRSLDLDEAPADNAPRMRSSITDGYYVAPPGCLQYFPHKQGVITSFNYNRGEGTYPGNMNYAICLRREEDTHGVELKAVVFNLGAENLSRNSTEQLDNYCYSGQVGDYLMVPQSTVKLSKAGSNQFATFFCGQSIDGNTITSSNPGPLMMLFNSGTNHKQNVAGFYISFKLQ